jgi:hypothetical protein
VSLQAVLDKVAAASTLPALRECERAARGLPDEDKAIARWSYAYAREQLRLGNLMEPA